MKEEHLLEVSNPYKGLFKPVRHRQQGNRAREILDKLRNWEYIPSRRCIVQVFRTSYATAKKAQEQLLSIWNRPIADEDLVRIRNDRSFLRRFLEFETEEKPKALRGLKMLFRRY